ncbi:MAG: hypothetical protein R2939_23065, partial [Kofleriaceae bacterium]
MGLFDVIKGIFGGAAAPAQAPATAERDDDEVRAAGSGAQVDLAGFDPEDDEDGFFEAAHHLETDGMLGGTDASRAEIMARYGLRDRAHWHQVKEACYAVLVRKHGSIEEVGQRQMNWKAQLGQQHQRQAATAMAASGGFAPVQGLSLEAWAALNAAIASGMNAEDVLKGAGVSKARWDAASAEWNARMAADTTFAITTAYGNAFQAASQGKYNHLAKEANAARA